MLDRLGIKTVLFRLVILFFVLFLHTVASYANKAEKTGFDLWELRVKGNTLLGRSEIERTLYPFLGPKKSIDIVEQARLSLENLFQMKGYKTVSVDIPEQDVVNGVVYLQVVEGKISRLRVKDSRYFSLGKIKSSVPALAEGNVPNLTEMQAQLTELSKQTSDRRIIPIMRAGKTPGTIEVDLKVQDKLPLHASLELTGRNSQDTSRTRLTTSVSYDNLWQRFHSASFMYQTSPEKPSEVEVFSGTYVLPIFDSSTRLALYAVSSQSNSQVAAGDLNVIGSGDIFGARLIKPFEGTGSYMHSMTLGVDYKHFTENVLLGNTNASSTPISYLPFMVQYQGNIRAKDMLASLNLGLNFSLRGVANDEAEFEAKRAGARPDFFYLTAGGKVSYNLPWGMELATRASAQYSDGSLISNEQFFMGGATSVRGYFESQALADDGVMGSIELYSPRLTPNDWDFINNFKLLIFADAAKGWIKQALPGQESRIALYSSGVGARFQLWKYLVGSLDFAIPLIIE
ncbi:MAG: ShlB/FhaC/HecB family hemolysin secretion/activation protein [Methylococcales bacterium]